MPDAYAHVADPDPGPFDMTAVSAPQYEPRRGARTVEVADPPEIPPGTDMTITDTAALQAGRAR